MYITYFSHGGLQDHLLTSRINDLNCLGCFMWSRFFVAVVKIINDEHYVFSSTSLGFQLYAQCWIVHKRFWPHPCSHAPLMELPNQYRQWSPESKTRKHNGPHIVQAHNLTSIDLCVWPEKTWIMPLLWQMNAHSPPVLQVQATNKCQQGGPSSCTKEGQTSSADFGHPIFTNSDQTHSPTLPPHSHIPFAIQKLHSRTQNSPKLTSLPRLINYQMGFKDQHWRTKGWHIRTKALGCPPFGKTKHDRDYIAAHIFFLPEALGC